MANMNEVGGLRQRVPAIVPDQLRAERGDKLGPIRFMAAADNYVMVRRPGCMPWCEPLADWLKRPLEASTKPLREAYQAAQNAP